MWSLPLHITYTECTVNCRGCLVHEQRISCVRHLPHLAQGWSSSPQVNLHHRWVLTMGKPSHRCAFLSYESSPQVSLHRRRDFTADEFISGPEVSTWSESHLRWDFTPGESSPWLSLHHRWVVTSGESSLWMRFTLRRDFTSDDFTVYRVRKFKPEVSLTSGETSPQVSLHHDWVFTTGESSPQVSLHFGWGLPSGESLPQVSRHSGKSSLHESSP